MDFLQQIDQGKRRFQGIVIDDMDCSESEIYELELRDCVFRNVNFRGAVLEGLQTQDCTFTTCNFSHAKLMESQFTHTSFYQLSAECTFYEADCRLCKFEECDIRLANFEQARLFRSVFYKTNATGANFFRADFNLAAEFVDCNFRMVDLRDAQLANCDLHKTIFEQADLRDANLTKCNLTACDFAGARIAHLKIQEADLRGANIAGFDIRTLDFTGVTIYDEQGKVLLENAGINLVARTP